MGVHVHLEKTTTAVAGRRRGSPASPSRTAATLDCDMVVVSAGIRPNAEIGHALRAAPSSARIVVDNHMRSVDDLDVYVVGECAQHRGRVYGLVAPLWEQAKVLADHITGAQSATPPTTARSSRPSSR